MGPVSPTFLDRKGESTDPNDKKKKKTTKRGGQIGIVSPSISFSKQVSNKIMKTNAKGKEYVAKEVTKKGGASLDGGLILDFPILTKPEQAMRLLVGADVDLFTLILPTLTISFDFNKSQTIMAGPVPITFGIGLSIDISVTLAFGMEVNHHAFEPDEARRLVKHFEFHFTPKNGSWLNMAEIELSVLSRQCLNRRISDDQTLTWEVPAWVNDEILKLLRSIGGSLPPMLVSN